MKRILMLTLSVLLICAFMLPILASCDLAGSSSGNKVWFCRKNGDVEYYISFDEKKGEMLVVVVDGKDAESFTLDYEINDEEIEIKDSLKNKEVFKYKEKSDSYVTIDGLKFKIADKGPKNYEKGGRDFTVYELVGKLGDSVLSGNYTATNRDGDTANVLFGADGSIRITVFSKYGTSAETANGTYEIKGDVIAITFGGETNEFSYEYDNGTLIIDGIEYTPKNNSVTVKPTDTVEATREPEYSIDPPKDPEYTVPNHGEDSPIYTHPGYAEDTAVPVDPYSEYFNATYETKDLHEGMYCRWIFLDDGTWVLYEMYGAEGEELERGKYRPGSKRIVITSEFKDGINFEIDRADIERKFSYGGMEFYFIAPYAELPSNVENDYEKPEERASFIGTYMADDTDGDAVTYMLVMDAGIYTLYSINMWGENATQLDKGTYREKGEFALMESVYEGGLNGRFIMKDADILVYEDDSMIFNRVSWTADHPDTDDFGGATDDGKYFSRTYRTDPDKETGRYTSWAFFMDGTYEIITFEGKKSYRIDEGTYNLRGTSLIEINYSTSGKYSGKIKLSDDGFNFDGEWYMLTSSSFDGEVTIATPSYKDYDTGIIIHFGTVTTPEYATDAAPENDTIIYNKFVYVD